MSSDPDAETVAAAARFESGMLAPIFGNSDSWEQKKWLSEKQEETLERIYANKTP